MNSVLQPDAQHFESRLVSWAIRGVFCAGPSFVWAVIAEFRSPLQIGAMLAGVATYVLAFAWATSLPAYLERIETGELGWALRVAANTRAVLAPAMFFCPDVWLGFVAIQSLELGARVFGLADIDKLHPFAWTYAVTLVQGALVSATMLALASGLWAVRRCYRMVWRANRVAAGGEARLVEPNGSV